MKRASSSHFGRLTAVMLAMALGMLWVPIGAVAAEVGRGDCGAAGAPRSTAGAEDARSGPEECGDSLAILRWIMALPTSGGPTSTGPGGADIPGTPSGTLLALPPTVAPGPVLAAGQFRPNEVLVLLQPGATADVARALARDYALQLEVYAPSRVFRTAVVRFRIPDARPIDAVLAVLVRDPRVRSTQPNYIYRPADAAVGEVLPQYALELIGARQAAARLVGTRQPVVAVVDTGIDDSHPDLQGVVRDRFDAVGDGRWDTGAHGTGIASIIGARGHLIGVAPQAALLSVRAFPAGDSQASEATSLALLRGLDWALSQSADVINLSLTGPPDPMVDAAVEETIKAGAIVVAAAGNGGPGAPPAYPAAVAGVIAVTATDEHDGLFKGANHGAYITIAAPGVDILSAAPGGGYAMATGTSQAAAEASGVIALMRAMATGLTPQSALDIVSRSAKNLGPRTEFGAGRIDAQAALDALGTQQANQ